MREPEGGLAAEAVGAGPDLVSAEVPLIAARSPWEAFSRRFREDRLAMAALIFIGVLASIAILAPLVVEAFGAPGPDERDTSALDVFGTPTGPSSDHLLGVDQIGRDVFSRTVYGARVSLVVAFVATGLATIVGVIAGLLAGYLRGWVDVLVSRSVDVLLAIPYLLLATGLAASCAIGDGCLGGLLKPG
ncbi:MAG: ABC transporter permease, partial [Candidatus Rokuibacteriota bacterium]